MKFALIASHAESVINFRSNLIKSLKNKSVEVHVIIPHLSSNNIAIKSRIEEIGASVHEVRMNRTSLNPILDFITLLEFLVVLWKIKPDYILAYTIKPIIYGMLAAKIIGIKYRFALITGLGSVFNEGNSVKNKLLLILVKYMYRFSLLNISKVFFQNPDDMSFFCNHKITYLLQSCVVNGSGVDLGYYNFSTPPNKVSFLLLARLLNSKGVCIYFEAARIIKSTHPHIKFSLAGEIDSLNVDSISRSELDTWTKSKIITYHGQLEDVRTSIANCSVYVLPTFYREGTPRSILEALSIGRAIITTDTPGCRETVIQGKNGYLIEPKSVSKLVESMMKFINEPNIVERMGFESRKIAEEKYDVHKVNDFMFRHMKIE